MASLLFSSPTLEDTVTNLHSPLSDPALAMPVSRSRQGTGREENQDARAVGENVWLVADGMGGHTGGQVASRAAAVAADRAARNDPLAPLTEIIETAHEAVLKAADERGMSDMGSTIVIAAQDCETGVLRVAWAGDSRAYLLTAAGLRRLTDDHNIAEVDRLARGLEPDDVWDHPGQHHLTSFLGGGHSVVPEIGVRVLAARGRLLLCSDGLTSGLRDSEIEEVLRVGTPEDAAQLLISAALDGGSTDDITVIVVDLT